MPKKNFIGFVGLSHLGLNYLAASVQKKFKVIGVDSDKKLISDLDILKIPFSEPGLSNILRKNRKKIEFSSDFKRLKKCKIIFISQDVDTSSRGESNLNQIYKLIFKTKKYIQKKSIMVILSQLRPGFMRKIKFDRARLFYQIETLIFGKGVLRALSPERIIIGCYDKNKDLEKSYRNYLLKFKCPIIKMNYESAELTKIAINIFLASNITTTNVLAETCKKIGANWNEIKPALHLDARIGPKAYLRPGLGISGGNIERDISSLKNLISKDLNLKKFTTTLINNSRYMSTWVLRQLINEKVYKNKKNKISILGLSYKEDTNSIKNSPSIKLISKLKKNRFLKVYDPKVILKINMKNCFQISSINQTLKGTKILIIMTPWKNFEKIRIDKSVKLVIDPFNVLKMSNKKNLNYKYYTIG